MLWVYCVCVCVCVGRLWDFKYLKMNYINMHKFHFKWAQLTFSCLLSLSFCFCFWIQHMRISCLIFIIIFIHILISTLVWCIRKLRCDSNSQHEVVAIKPVRDRARPHTQWAKDGFYIHVIRLSLGYSSVSAVKRLNGRLCIRALSVMQMGYKKSV